MLQQENPWINIPLFIGYLALIVYIFNKFRLKPDPPLKYYHPFDQWWRRKETSISPWYQDHFFDSKRRDNLYPTYQNI